MLVLMNTPHELLAEGVAYARCYFAAMVAALLLNMGTALLRAVGDTRGPAVIIASGCLVNVCWISFLSLCCIWRRWAAASRWR